MLTVKPHVIRDVTQIATTEEKKITMAFDQLNKHTHIATKREKKG